MKIYHGKYLFKNAHMGLVMCLGVGGFAIGVTTASLADVQPTNETRVVSPTPLDYDWFGDTVQIDDAGETIIAGIPNRDNVGAYAGVAEIFTYNGSSWSWQATLAGTTQAEAAFGLSTAISEDGNRVVVGAPFEDGPGGALDEDSGAAYLYTRNGSSWPLTKKLQGHDTQWYDYFGDGVGISGDTVVVGADGAEVGFGVYPGAAYVFVDSGGVVTEQQKLSSSDGVDFDWFGWSVAIDGNTIAVGAPGDDVGATESGSIYMFERTGTNWLQTTKIYQDDPAVSNWFGLFLALDGDTLAVGNAYKDGPGANYEAGAVDVYVRSGVNWTKQARLRASNLEPYAWFGFGVDVSGDVIAVGAPYATGGGVDYAGQTYLFQRSGTNWTQTAHFTPGSPSFDDESGWDVGLCDSRVVTVANNETVSGHVYAGAMYVYDLVYDTFLSPLITWIAPTNVSDMALAFTSESGANYRVDYRDSMTSGGWSTLTNNIPGTGGEITVVDEAPLATNRFYQVVIP